MTAISTVAYSCLACGKADAKSRCGGCRRVHFCDRECQRQSWRSHRAACLDASRIPSESTRIPTDCIHAAVAPSTSDVVPYLPELPQPHTKQHKNQHKPPPPRSKKQHKTRRNSVHVLPSHANTAAATSASRTLVQQLITVTPTPPSTRKPRSVSLGAKKHVVWGDVCAREFARFPGGGGAVPHDGTWALGLGQPLADVQLGSVLALERVQTTLPLFARLGEDARKRLLTLEDKDKDADDKSAGETRAASLLHGHRLEAEAALQTPDFGCVSVEQLDEFARIRDSRDGACGCSCGDWGRKVGKMSAKRLRAFLRARHVQLLPGCGKSELLAAAKELVSQHRNCEAADTECECARNGVPCHADVCVGCVGSCCNPLEGYVYKGMEVQRYRRAQLVKYQEQQQLLQGTG